MGGGLWVVLHCSPTGNDNRTGFLSDNRKATACEGSGFLVQREREWRTLVCLSLNAKSPGFLRGFKNRAGRWRPKIAARLLLLEHLELVDAVDRVFTQFFLDAEELVVFRDPV